MSSKFYERQHFIYALHWTVELPSEIKGVIQRFFLKENKISFVIFTIHNRIHPGNHAHCMGAFGKCFQD